MVPIHLQPQRSNLVALSLLYDGLMNGGPAAMVYGLLFAFARSLATFASLAEMTSM